MLALARRGSPLVMLKCFLKRTAIAYGQKLALLLGSRWYVPEYSGSSPLKTLQGHGTSMILDRIY